MEEITQHNPDAPAEGSPSDGALQPKGRFDLNTPAGRAAQSETDGILLTLLEGDPVSEQRIQEWREALVGVGWSVAAQRAESEHWTPSLEQDSYDELFGLEVRAQRENKAWSMTEFAAKLSDAGLANFHPTTVARMERGERPVRLNEAVVIASVLGSSLARMVRPITSRHATSDSSPTRAVCAPAPTKAADLMTTAEAAAMLHSPVATLRWWRHQGTGPRAFVLGGRRVMYKREDVERWLQEQYETGE